MDSPHNSRTSSTPAVASSLRPRNRRLISGLDDEPADGLQSISSARIASPLPSPYESRAASPIPCKHLSRLASSNPARQTSDLDSSRPGAGLGPVNGKEPSGSLSALWGSSWTSLQGLASDLLGSNTTAAAKDKSVRTRKPLEATHRRSATSVPPVQWGPSTSTTASHRIGAGSKEGREALVRSKKREDLLRANGHAYTDVAGRFKRRTSDDRASVSAPPGENEDREALVYIHRVRPEDTLPGITIKYNCQAATLRKANRMWPNDSIQSRKTIVLPVDACGVKGRRISAPEGEDVLAGGSSNRDLITSEDNTATPTPTAPSDWHPALRRRESSAIQSTPADRPASSNATSDTDSQWQHDFWVLFPTSSDPVEIVRLPRRTLGFFPPARRKSNSYSDLDTPSASLDLPRLSLSSSNNALPSPSLRPGRQRRSSNSSNAYFPSYLAGPGGVGTMAPNVRCPGPAQDGLNKLFAKHLPDVAPPPNQQGLYLPDIPGYSDGTTTPLASGANSPGVHLGEVSGAIEGWVRKIASKAAHALEQPPGGDGKRAARASVGMPGPGAGGVGDLIELADAFEIGGEDDDDEEEQRGRQGSAVMQSPVESTRGLSRVQEDSGLRERTRSGGGLNRRNREKGD
ncbi:hypothetical protein BJ546DRAFT_519082 [Cryomyces antarcticus]